VRWPAIAGICLAACLVAGFAVSKRHNPGVPAATPRLHPEAAVLRRYGHRAYQNGDYEMARRYYGRAVRLDPENRDPQAQQELGCALLKLGRASSAQTGQADRNGVCNP
jgi:tetratricopeptide (TPR) repeat protein